MTKSPQDLPSYRPSLSGRVELFIKTSKVKAAAESKAIVLQDLKLKQDAEANKGDTADQTWGVSINEVKKLCAAREQAQKMHQLSKKMRRLRKKKVKAKGKKKKGHTEDDKNYQGMQGQLQVESGINWLDISIIRPFVMARSSALN